MGSNPAHSNGVGDAYPVYFVSWYPAIKYCNLRSMAEGLTPCYTINGSTDPADWGALPTTGNSTWDAVICDWNANGYRLPTEAEWEYAARGATTNPDYLYSGSDNIDAVAWYTGNNSPSGTKPVGTKSPNGIGNYDMTGNVQEWCWDWLGADYYANSPLDNPTGPASGSEKMLRGGGWFHSPIHCRNTMRFGAHNNGGYDSVGFRLCRSIP